MPSLSQLVPAAAEERVQALVFTPCRDPVYFYLLKLWLLRLFTLWYHLEMLMWGSMYSGAVPQSAPSMFCYRDVLEFIFKTLITSMYVPSKSRREKWIPFR